MNDEMVRYVIENRDRYTREAIERRLLEAGHTPADVAAAFRRAGMPGTSAASPFPPIAGGSDEPPGRRPPSDRIADSPWFWLSLVGIVLGGYGGAALASYALGIGLGAVLPLGLLAGALLAALLLLRRNRPLALGLLTGVMTAMLIPFVLVVVLAGLCAAGVIPGLAG